MPKRSQIIIIVAAIVAVVTGALAYVAFVPNKGPDASAVLDAVPEWAMRVGSPNASMIVIEFFDPLCPYCAVVHYRFGGELHRLVEEGRLRLILIPLPVRGNESLVLINAFHCAYREVKGDALQLLNRWYEALVEYAVNKTENKVRTVLEKLGSYKCDDALTLHQIVYALYKFENAGIVVRGVPTFVVIKGGQVTVIEGAKIKTLKSVLT